MSIEAYPLHWPVGWQRTPAEQRERAKFGKSRAVYRPDGTLSHHRKDDLTVADAIKRLRHELELLGAGSVVVSTNVMVRLDGMPYSSASGNPKDPGIAVYFRLNDTPYCLPCDKWDRVADNLAAVAAHVDAMRGMERWGVGSTAAHFAGFKALPPKGGTTVGEVGAPWWQVFGLAESATIDEAERAFRQLAAKHHPDRGGDAGAFAALTRAREQARAARGTS